MLVIGFIRNTPCGRMGNMKVKECPQCDSPVGLGGSRGRRPRYCSPKCRQAAYRERKALAGVFPSEMAGVTNWVRADGKRPLQTSGAAASSTMPSTWATLADVRDGVGDGFGFMLGAGSGVGCYDFDNALEGGSLKSWAVAELRAIPERVIFTEVSVSGLGLHVFVLADEGRGSRRPVGDGSVERYSRARFIRVTGNVFSERS